MAVFEEVKVISQVSIDENGRVSIRESTRILKDGVQIAPDQFHRYVLEPGEDVTQKESVVKNVCGLIWTPDVIQKHRDSKSPKSEIKEVKS